MTPRLKKWRAMISGIVLAVLVSSCATKTQGEVKAAATPPARAAIESSASSVDTSTKAVEESNQLLRTQVVKLKTASSDAKNAATLAREEAERLKNSEQATAAELDALWKLVSKVEARNMFLEEETNKLADQTEDQHAKILELRATVEHLKSEAIKKDGEVAALRFAKAESDAAIKQANERIKALSAAAVEAASAKSYKAILFWIGGGLLLVILVYISIKAMKRL